MAEYNIIYELPFNGLVKEKTSQEVGDMLFKMMYSMLTVNRFYYEEIMIYTDFEGMSILSVLPFNFEIVYYDNVSSFKKRIIKMQYKPFLLLNENIYFKSPIEFKGNQIHENGLIYVDDLPSIRENTDIDLSKLPEVVNITSFENNVDVKYAREFIKDLSDVLYNNFMEKINNRIEYK